MSGEKNEHVSPSTQVSRIERELGEGRMGVVYLVADEQVPGEGLAIKVLKQELHPANLRLLREEVR